MTRQGLSLWIIAIAICATLGVSAQAEYVAFAVTKDGEKPLPEDLGPILAKDAKDLVQFKWPDYPGKKLRLGVRDAENGTSYASMNVVGPNGQMYSYDYSSHANQVPVQGIDAMLASALIDTGRFTVVERSNELNAVLGEQDLGESGRIAKPSAAKTGMVLGAQYLIQAVVNSYEPNVSGKKGGIGGLARRARILGGVKGGIEKSKVMITFKLIDAQSGEIVASTPVESTISKKSLGLAAVGWGSGGALGGFFEGYSKTPIGQAVMAAVNAGVFKIVQEVGNQPVAGSVVKVTGSQIILNLGDGQVSPGDELRASSKGEELIDPETGQVLATNDIELGTMRVKEVKDNISFAEAVGFDPSTLTAGDRVVSTQAPESLQYGSPW